MINAGFVTFFIVFMAIGQMSYMAFSPIDSGSMTAVLREFYSGTSRRAACGVLPAHWCSVGPLFFCSVVSSLFLRFAAQPTLVSSCWTNKCSVFFVYVVEQVLFCMMCHIRVREKIHVCMCVVWSHAAFMSGAA